MPDENLPQLKRGGLFERRGFWYFKYTYNGVRKCKSTRCRDYADAVSRANQMFTLQERLVDDRWVRHVKESMKNSRSWLRELMRKVRHRHPAERIITPDEIERIAIR